ncbi:MAG: aminotransferase class V-fold PLP-dependent enzyme [Bacillota bacterium]|nr:aminotransferase class V-fold PLP-dependent enzyme [Bacillota bacterium]
MTEIDGFDDLHRPQGIIKEAQEAAAEVFGAEATYFSVNGSTCGILSAVAACTDLGDKVVLARNCHKAVYHALELRALRPLYLMPRQRRELPFCGSISPDDLKTILNDHEDIRAVIVTSPTYEGIISDISSLAKLCHSKDIPLIVDEAHGSHLGLDPELPTGALSCGADIVIQSLHKTLPSLTQTALIHVQGSLVNKEEVQRRLNIFETSSPSYLLMASIDNCVTLIGEKASELFPPYLRRLEGFRETCRSLEKLKVWQPQELISPTDFAFAADPGKIIIQCLRDKFSGCDLAAALRRSFRLELEMAQVSYALAMTSPMNSDEDFQRLSSALSAIDSSLPPSKPVPPCPPPVFPSQAVLTINQALAAPYEEVPLKEAPGRVAAQYFWLYPPGVPQFVPGEIIPQGVRGKDGANLTLRCVRP